MTLEPESNHSYWIGYQVLAGIGLGLCFNVYIIIIQNIVKPEEVATATAILLCKSCFLNILGIFANPSSSSLPILGWCPRCLCRPIDLSK